MRLTKKLEEPIITKYLHYNYMRIADYDIDNGNYGRITDAEIYNKLGQLEDIENELGVDLITFLKGIDPNTCFMQITQDKKFYLCGDAYYGNYSKEGLLELIQELLFMYWALIKENKQ